MTKLSPCKVNLILNILGKRADGFHELETVMQPVPYCDEITLERQGTTVELTCSLPELPVDGTNLVHRAATGFLEAAGIREGVKIHLEKKIPLAAGLGGGSGNAATTLLGLNELFGQPLAMPQLTEIAACLGSDVPFFLQSGPGLGIGRGEKITSLPAFPALKGTSIILIHPGFGIATAWAYKELARFPQDLNGTPGRAQKLIDLLQTGDLRRARMEFYNSLEAPALEKYPILGVYQGFLRENGALATLMSGSGSTTFALAASQAEGEKIVGLFREHFGDTPWIVVVPL